MLKINCFALGYIDQNQEHTLKRCGHKAICFDGTNPDALIIHAMVVTDVGCECYSIAFLLGI